MEVLATWQPDPTGRHETRYWDGDRWTASVADGGVVSDDPPTWAAPPAPAGLGLRSGYLRYFHGGSGPWPVADGSGAQVGWVTRGPFGLGGRSAEVWDMQNLWLRVRQSMRGTLILLGDDEIGLVGWHGVGAMSTINISLQLQGRVRARMLAKHQDLAEGTATVVDPAGSGLLSLQIQRQETTKILTLRRLVGTPEGYEYLIQAMVPAIILELDSRTGFDPTHGVSHVGPWG
jgi:hypothetical protein